MSTQPVVVVSTVAVLFTAVFSTAPDVSAQERGIRCPEPTVDVETIIQRVEDIAAGRTTFGRNTPLSAMSYAVDLPFVETQCPILRPDVDVQAALVRLLQYATDHDDDKVAGPVMRYASKAAFRLSGRLNWAPTDIVFTSAQEGRTVSVRWAALLALVRQATDPQIRARLLALLRRPSGPPSWPDLPAEFLTHLQYMPDEGARLLDAELRSAPDLVRDPVARWQIACGRAGETRPMHPADPCHPLNAPRKRDRDD